LEPITWKGHNKVGAPFFGLIPYVPTMLLDDLFGHIQPQSHAFRTHPTPLSDPTKLCEQFIPKILRNRLSTIINIEFVV
jgi:hypothetical protein